MDQTMLKAQLKEIYDALREKGYNPVGQLVGYILTEDPETAENSV